MRKDRNFFNKLTDETFEFVEEADKQSDQKNVSNNLAEYYDIQKSNHDDLNISQYIEQYDGKLIGLDFIQETSCFRLSVENTIIDFPSNWSIFTLMKESLEDKNILIKEFSEETDPILYEVLSQKVFKYSKYVVFGAMNETAFFVQLSSKNKLLDCIDFFLNEDLSKIA